MKCIIEPITYMEVDLGYKNKKNMALPTAFFPEVLIFKGICKKKRN